MTIRNAYRISEVSGTDFASPIHSWNILVPEWPALQDRHLSQGFWWFAYGPIGAIAFAGMVPFEPFPGVGYFKRAYVEPAHRGKGLQLRLMEVREAKARELGWTQLVSECSADNTASARNFAAAGFESCEPEQRWGARESLYWSKRL